MSICTASKEICNQVGFTLDMWGTPLAFGIAQTNITVHGVIFAFGEPDYKLLFGIFLNIFGVLLVLYYSFFHTGAQDQRVSKITTPASSQGKYHVPSICSTFHNSCFVASSTPVAPSIIPQTILSSTTTEPQPASPLRLPVEPIRAATPAPASPVRSAEPVHQSPVQSPIRGTESPVRVAESPVRVAGSPVRVAESPLRAVTPVSVARSPAPSIYSQPSTPQHFSTEVDDAYELDRAAEALQTPPSSTARKTLRAKKGGASTSTKEELGTVFSPEGRRMSLRTRR